MNIKLELTQEETGFLMGVLAELPTKTGAFLVMNEIARQVQEQTPKNQEIVDV